ncbi:hypothetical protein GOBAR_DD23427 [Gossypium barbadense]|nr:hypothetical protein GOBAR_DD23427 [Gossypium barbadense]
MAGGILLIECDSKTTVDLILGAKVVGSPRLALEVCNWMTRDWQVEIQHVPQTVNMFANANTYTQGGKAENVEHAFRDCLAVKEIWGKLGIEWPQELNKGQFKDWMLYLYYSVSIQKCRGERWRSPKESYVKINFDAAFHKQSKSSCSRIVVRDSSGRVLNFTMRLNEHIPTGFVAEAIVCVQAVQLGPDFGIIKAEIEGNVLSVIKAKKVVHALAVEELKGTGGTYLQNGFPRSTAMEVEDDRRRASLRDQNGLLMNKVDGFSGGTSESSWLKKTSAFVRSFGLLREVHPVSSMSIDERTISR